MSLVDLLILPPLNCLFAACAGAVLGRRVLLGAGLGGLALLSVPLVSGSLLASLGGGRPASPDPHDPPRAIVILSGDETTLAAGGDMVGHLTLDREREGAVLARATGLPILVTGGVIRPGADSLASLMARSLLDDFGRVATWQEKRSKDTWQNAAFSAAILRPAGIGTVYLVTHAWHMRRALIAFRAAGLHAVPVPVPADRPPALTLADLVPRVSAWQEGYYALHEWVGCAWYSLRE